MCMYMQINQLSYKELIKQIVGAHHQRPTSISSILQPGGRTFSIQLYIGLALRPQTEITKKSQFNNNFTSPSLNYFLMMIITIIPLYCLNHWLGYRQQFNYNVGFDHNQQCVGFKDTFVYVHTLRTATNEAGKKLNNYFCCLQLILESVEH
jgi:hypothetical protein